MKHRNAVNSEAPTNYSGYHLAKLGYFSYLYKTTPMKRLNFHANIAQASDNLRQKLNADGDQAQRPPPETKT